MPVTQICVLGNMNIFLRKKMLQFVVIVVTFHSHPNKTSYWFKFPHPFLCAHTPKE